MNRIQHQEIGIKEVVCQFNSQCWCAYKARHIAPACGSADASLCTRSHTLLQPSTDIAYTVFPPAASCTTANRDLELTSNGHLNLRNYSSPLKFALIP